MMNVVGQPSAPAYVRKRQRIAVVGSGAAGLAAAWALSRNHDVHLFESEDRLGGHAHTVDLHLGGVTIPVDVGFIVFNNVNYPALTAAFDTLRVATEESSMSFSVSINNGQFEYSGRWPGGVLSQKRNLLSPPYWAMLLDIRRFYSVAASDLPGLENEQVSLKDYLDGRGFSRAFRSRHLFPMVAAIWSLPTAGAGSMPAAGVIRFFKAHGLLSLRHRPQWRTVTGGSRNYVTRLLGDFDGTVHLRRAVRGVSADAKGATLLIEGFGTQHFDHVVLATHGDQALNLLAAPSTLETEILGAFRYIANRAVLHGDPGLMPRRTSAWASWNFIETAEGEQGVTYWMNRLQNLPTQDPVFVTLNPPIKPDPDLTYRSFNFTHPVFDQSAISAQSKLPVIQGRNRTWFCGSYFGYGFHEDAFASGLRAAAQLNSSVGHLDSGHSGQGTTIAHE